MIHRFVSETNLELVIKAFQKHRDLSLIKSRQWIAKSISLGFDSIESNSIALWIEVS